MSMHRDEKESVDPQSSRSALVGISFSRLMFAILPDAVDSAGIFGIVSLFLLGLAYFCL